jgi:hypothetical protein
VLVSVVLYVVAAPLFAVRYPPITDLPFHAAHTSTFRHYLDPAWHFREQFTLHPLAVPYLSMYALGAALMCFLPMITAVKIAAASMLALLPVGLAVLFHGMKKSPLLGLAALPLVWCNLTHWGFFNFVGALGLFAMVVGSTLMVVERPTRGRQLLLAGALVALFFTHIFRFPFALCAVVGTALVMAPATRRLSPVLLPMAPAVALFVAWTRARTDALAVDFGPLTVHTERLAEMRSLLFGGLTDPAEEAAVRSALRLVLAVAAISLLSRALDWRAATLTRRRLLWRVGTVVAVASCAAVFLFLFLTLPMQLGAWWYVYPREATAAAFVALGLLPDLPRARWLQLPLAAMLCAAGIGVGRVVVDNYRAFAPAAEEFHTIAAKLPPAPRLMYLVFDHGGSTRSTTPFIHLPAYVQAERGGWLSFHFAMWRASPVLYRDPAEPGAVVPPSVPLRWEWTPHLFQTRKHGQFFDWFLVRRSASPDSLFRDDPTIERVEHVGSWWLYRRVGASP